MALEDIEEVDDSESNRSGPSKTEEEKEPNLADESESNKAGPSGTAVISVQKTCYMHIDLTPTDTSKAIKEEEAPNIGCLELKDVDDLERIPWPSLDAFSGPVRRWMEFIEKQAAEEAKKVEPERHKITQLGFRFSQLTRLVRPQSRIRSTSRKYRHRQQAGRSSPSLERSLKDEDERPGEQQGQEEEAPRSGNSENESETAHQRYLRKGNAAVTDSSSEQHQEQEQEAPKSGNSRNKEVPESSNKSESESAHERYLRKGKAVVIDSSSKQHQEEDCVDFPESIDETAADKLMPSEEVDRIDEIAADQLMLSEEVDLLLDEVRNLEHQALDLSKEPINYERAQTLPNIVTEWYRSGITNTIEPRRLFFRNLELADKVNRLRSYVADLQPLVTYLQSQLRTRSGGWIYGCFKQSERSSPTFGRVRETL